MTRPLALTMGDPAGIGPEIIARLFAGEPAEMMGVAVCGDVGIIRRALGGLGSRTPVARIGEWREAMEVPAGCVPVLQATQQALARLPVGRVSAAGGQAAADCVIMAARAALQGEVSGVVTAPLNKAALAAAGLDYPGHTELLQSMASAACGRPVAVRMMLANEELRTVLVSIHVSLRQAIEAVTMVSVLETIAITHDALTRILGRSPRIAVAGLNPHASESGLFGFEDERFVRPAVEDACRRGWAVTGPWPADTVFMRARRGEFDVVVAMYHDQGLIPVKYLGVEHGVNVTLGLPFVRTSPDHGTAFDIVGRGLADPSSLRAAVRMARTLARGGADPTS